MEVMFVRNGPVIIFHDSILNKQKKEKLAESLSDFSLVAWKNILSPDPKEYSDYSFFFHIHYFNYLDYERFNDTLNTIYSMPLSWEDERYVGIKFSDLLLKREKLATHKVFFCKNTDIHEKYKINAKKLVLDLDLDNVFEDVEGEFLKNNTNKLLNQYFKKSNIEKVSKAIINHENVLTPIVIRHKFKEFIIGFVFSSKEYKTELIILCLSEGVLMNRSVAIKLLSHFLYITLEGLGFLQNQLQLTEEGDFYLNFTMRHIYNLSENDKFNVVEVEKFDEEFEYLTFGCDVEFSYLKEHYNEYGISYETVQASEIIEAYYQNLGCDVSELNLEKEKIGTDGDRWVGEIRTSVYEMKEDSYDDLAREITSTMIDAVLCGYDYECDTTFASESLPTGFHIHIGFKDFNKYDITEGKLIAKNFILLLDLVLTSNLTTINSDKRFASTYAECMNCELKKYGFEYRSLPSTILYYRLHKKVLRLFQKVAEDYYKNRYVIVELENVDKISKKFYKKYLKEETDEYFKTIKKLRDLIAKNNTIAAIFLEMPLFSPIDYSPKVSKFISPVDYFTNEFRNFAVELNLKYTKDCIVYFYGLHKNRGDNITTIKNTEFCIEEVFLSRFFVTHQPMLTNYNVYKVGIARNLRELENGEDYETKIYYLSSAIYHLLKWLEENGNLTKPASKVYEKLAKKYRFLKSDFLVEKEKHERKTLVKSG